ncbi:MAG: divalent-cation tolerance protein CutA [Bacteroidota bacterium]
MENAENFRIVFVTTNSFKNAQEIAHALLTEKLIACANIIPAVTSIYEWNGNIEESSEFLILLKTYEFHLEKLEKCITAIHPYDVPEIITTSLKESSAPYLAWLTSSLE